MKRKPKINKLDLIKLKAYAHQRKNIISIERSKCAFAKIKAKLFENSSFYSVKERTERKRKRKNSSKLFSNIKFLFNLLVLDILNFAFHDFRAPVCIHSTIMCNHVSDTVYVSGSRMMTDLIVKTVILLMQMF